MYISKEELLSVLDIMEENHIEGSIKLIQNNESGIGSILDMEFDLELNKRWVTVRANITDQNKW